jgi:hypothetical protein
MYRLGLASADAGPVSHLSATADWGRCGQADRRPSGRCLCADLQVQLYVQVCASLSDVKSSRRDESVRNLKTSGGGSPDVLHLHPSRSVLELMQNRGLSHHI